MIGYEFEFLVREGDRPLSKKTFEAFHGILAQRAWTPVFDPGTQGLVGSKKNGFFVTTDDGVCTMEINTPPRDTIHQCHEQISHLVSELQDIYQSLGCSIIGTSVFPGLYDIGNNACLAYCIADQCCNKSYIKYLNPQRFPASHHALYVFAAHQVWLDAKPQTLMRQWRVLETLSPLLYALFSNGPVFNDEYIGEMEGRDILWKKMLASSVVGSEEYLFGMTPEPFASLIEYFNFILAMPFYFSIREGKGYRLVDSKITYRDFFLSQKSEAEFFDGTRFIVGPTKEDFWGLQQKTFPHVRIKYQIREDVSLQEIISALQNRNESSLLDCFENVFLECRAISAQPQTDISAGPALLVGLQENIEEAKILASSRPYKEWQVLYGEVQRQGLGAYAAGIAITALAKGLIDISLRGLTQRGYQEEQFLNPLKTRLEKMENPSQELFRAWKRGGLAAIWQERDFRGTVGGVRMT
jgi:gamma-glutamylcysteine synthetase